MNGTRRSQLLFFSGLCFVFACLFVPFFFLHFLSTLRINTKSSSKNTNTLEEDTSHHSVPLIVTDFENGSSTSQSIPKIIHRLWRGEQEDIPEEWTNASKSCIDQNPSFEKYHWTDETALEFIQTHFTWFAPSYIKRLKARQREEVLRYFLLWHYGGIYMEQSLGCRAPMVSLLLNKTVLAPEPTSSGASNDLIASTANHAFMIAIAMDIHEDNMSRMSGYKGLFSTRQTSMNSALSMCLKPGKNCADVAVLPLARYDRTENATFTHYKAEGVYWGNGLAYDQIFGNLFEWTTAGVALVVMITLLFGAWIRLQNGRHHSVENVRV